MMILLIPASQVAKITDVSHQCHPVPSISAFFFFFGTGVWTQSLTLAGQAFYHLSHSTTSPLLHWVFLR
jgi:hypothetical protein